jgi:PAS domain S-box-containing protein
MNGNRDILASLAVSASDGIVITDREGRVEWVNHGFTRLCGHSLEEMLGKKPGQVLQGEGSDAAAIEELRRAMREGSTCSVEILNYHRDGHPYWVQINLTPIRDAAGTITNFAAIERDVTSRKIELAQRECTVVELYDAVLKMAEEVKSSANSKGSPS